MNVQPMGAIYLCETPLEKDNTNQLTFSNADTQIAYFDSKRKFTFIDYTYVRMDNSISIGANIDQIINCNYLYYRNNGFTERRYFCYITKKEYLNENATRIYFETDVFQTYQFDIEYKQCFIEREHVNDDTIGLHTVPEQLETGEYVNNGTIINALNSESQFEICMGVTELPKDAPENSSTRNYNSIYGGLTYLVFDKFYNCNQVIRIYDGLGKADAIVSIFLIHKLGLQYVKTNWNIDTGKGTIIANDVGYLADKVGSYNLGVYTLNRPTSINEYVPKNKKLFVYPYTYFIGTNNSGTDVQYSYEDFYHVSNNQMVIDNIEFNIESCITPGLSMKAIPLWYKNSFQNYLNGIVLGKLPVCSWNSDVYTNWLTQNGVNNALSIVGGVVKTGVGLISMATGNAQGSLSTIGGVMDIANKIGEIYQHSLIPNQAKGNTNSGDINFAYQFSGGFSLIPMSIKREYAKIIDDFFSMYGYKVNSVKLPNITGRKNWNYVKTVNCHFEGSNIPQEHLQTIRDIFNNGITLWHDPNTIYDYSTDNSII